MAVSTTDTYSGPYAANGSTVEFPFTFKAASESELRVFIVGAAGEEVTVDPDTYTVALSVAGGTVIFSTPPSGGDLYVESEPSFEQPIAFSSGQAYRPETVNEANDRSAIRDLHLKDQIGRAPKVPLAGGVEGQFPVVLPDGSWGFGAGTGSDPAFRSDVASPTPGKGASLVALTDGKTVEEKLNWTPRADIPLNGGDINFATSDTYGSTDEGASGGTWYYGRKIAGNVRSGPGPQDRGYGGAVMHYDVRYDTAKVVDADGDPAYDFLRVVHARTVMQSGYAGGRIAVLGEVIQQGPPDASSVNLNLQGGGFNTHIYHPSLGTDTGLGARTGAFGGGAGVFAHDGALNYLDLCGWEIDVYSQDNTSARFVRALSLVNGQRVRGTDLDAGLTFCAFTENFNGNQGWRHLICNTDANGRDPTAFDTTLWGTKWFTNPSTPRQVHYGLDWRGHTFAIAIISTPEVELSNDAMKLQRAQAYLGLSNGTREYQLQAVTAGDFVRVLAPGVGDLLRLFANGRVSFPQGIRSAADNAAAAAAGVEINEIYQSGGALRIRTA